MRMAVAAPKPSLREASCCRVEVMKGGGGLRRTWRRSIDGDGEGAALDLALGLLGALLGVEVELVELAAVEMGEAGLQRLLLGGAEQHVDRPVFAAS